MHYSKTDHFVLMVVHIVIFAAYLYYLEFDILLIIFTVEVDEERVNEESEELNMIISNKNTNDDKSGDVLITILIPQRSRIKQSRITYR